MINGQNQNVVWGQDPIQDPIHDPILHGKKLLMSGPKDKELIAQLKLLGATIQPTITKDTNYVIVKDPNENTAKANKARQLNILITTEELKQKYNL